MASSVSRSAFSNVSRAKPAFWISRTVRPSALSLRQAVRLVLEAPLLQERELRVLDVVGLSPAAVDHFLVEHGQVLAPEEPHEIVRADDQAVLEARASALLAPPPMGRRQMVSWATCVIWRSRPLRRHAPPCVRLLASGVPRSAARRKSKNRLFEGFAPLRGARRSSLSRFETPRPDRPVRPFEQSVAPSRVLRLLVDRAGRREGTSVPGSFASAAVSPMAVSLWVQLASATATATATATAMLPAITPLLEIARHGESDLRCPFAMRGSVPSEVRHGGRGNLAAASSGGLDWSQSSPAEPEQMKRATYEDVLNAPENKVAEILGGSSS